MKTLLIGGPPQISGTTREVPPYLDRFEVPYCPQETWFLGDPGETVQRHTYRKHRICDSRRREHVIFFHSSIQHGDEMAYLIHAATKR